MRALNTPPETFVLPPARSLFLEGSGDTALLLIHGFTGVVHDMKVAAEAVHATGTTVSVPRLPGHGTNRKDFLATTHDDWVRRIVDEYVDLAGVYRRVFVGGLSMGGLIATLVASRFPVAGLLLYAPAFTLFDRRLAITPIVGAIVPRIPKKHELENEDPDLRRIEEEYHTSDWVRPAGHLRRIQKIARRRLSKVVCPTLLVVSPADRTVPLSVREHILARLSGPMDVVELAESGHVVTNDVERDRVAAESVAWIERMETLRKT